MPPVAALIMGLLFGMTLGFLLGDWVISWHWRSKCWKVGCGEWTIEPSTGKRRYKLEGKNGIEYMP